MTEDQQHDIRNAVMVIFRISRHLGKMPELSQEQLTLVCKIQKESIRIGRAIGMVEEPKTCSSISMLVDRIFSKFR